MDERHGTGSDYTVRTCKPGELSDEELKACVSIIKDAGAVDVNLEKLRRAQLLAVARKSNEIVGVGSIKRVRVDYASRIATRSGFPFPVETPELGYVAVSEQHRGQGLSHRLVGVLLAGLQSGLFATTYDERMKKTLAGAGFVQKGGEWSGREHQLSLWLKS
jgi:predicted GNAT family N-acyltransferase